MTDELQDFIDDLEQAVKIGRETILEIVGAEDEHFGPFSDRTIKRRFTRKDAAELVGVTADAIIKAEKAGKLPEPDKDEKKKMLGYTIYQIDHMRSYFKTYPWKAENEEARVLCVTNLKGGCYKTTLSTYISQFAALNGRRVLFIDTDPQGSGSVLMNKMPDEPLTEPVNEFTKQIFRDAELGDDRAIEIKESLQSDHYHLTIGPLAESLENHEFEDLSYAIQSTHWPNLDIIQSSIALSLSNLVIQKLLSDDSVQPEMIYTYLRAGIEKHKKDYDLIVFDSSPDVAFNNVNLVAAADMVLMPAPLDFIDYHASVRYLEVFKEAFVYLQSNLSKADFGSKKVFRVLPTKFDKTNEISTRMLSIVNDSFERFLLKGQPVISFTQQVPVGNFTLRSIYETEPHNRSSREAHSRAIKIFANAFEPIMNELESAWPSKQDYL